MKHSLFGCDFKQKGGKYECKIWCHRHQMMLDLLVEVTLKLEIGGDDDKEYTATLEGG